MDKLEQFIEYAKLHLIRLEEDAEMLQEEIDFFTGDSDSNEYRDLQIQVVINTGEMKAANHLVSAATDILDGELAIRVFEN